jgi:hypothetical protein
MKVRLTVTVEVDNTDREYIAGAFCGRKGEAVEPATREEVKAYVEHVLPYIVANPYSALKIVEWARSGATGL